MKKPVISKVLVSFLILLVLILSHGISPLAAEAGTAQKTAQEPHMIVEGPGGPSTPGKQEADPDFSGKKVTVVAGKADDNGNLAIHFSEVTVAKILVSKKPLEIDMPAADLTFSAANVKKIVGSVGKVFTLQLGYDKAGKLSSRDAVTDQVSIGFKNVGRNNKGVDFSPAAKLAFKVKSNATNLQGVRKAANGQWKNVAGKKKNNLYTISMKEEGNYGVVSD